MAFASTITCQMSHTFGFCIHPLDTPGFLDQADHTKVCNSNRVSLYRHGMTSGNMILRGTSVGNLNILQQVLPSLQHLEVRFISHADQQTATIQTSFMQQITLRGLTCTCNNTNLTLEAKHLPVTCYAILRALLCTDSQVTVTRTSERISCLLHIKPG